MRCANPLCCCDSPYLRSGSLHLLEMEVSADLMSQSDDKGFPMRLSPQRFFWLCADCTARFIPRRWTPSGIVFALRNEATTHSDLLTEVPKPIAPARVPSQTAFLPARQKFA